VSKGTDYIFLQHLWQLGNIPEDWNIGENFFLSSWHFMQDVLDL
jgi:hypothetical protein